MAVHDHSFGARTERGPSIRYNIAEYPSTIRTYGCELAET